MRDRQIYKNYWSWIPSSDKTAPVALLFDIETNGLLEETTTIHCICAKEYPTGKEWEYGPDAIEEGLDLLSKADVIVAHNGMCFDCAVISRLYPKVSLPRCFDTLLASRLIWTNLSDLDFARVRRKTGYPLKLVGSHSLKAWGYRLDEHKGDYGEVTPDAWHEWSPEMQEYCMQDVRVLYKLYEHILEQNYSAEALALEHEFQKVIFMQEQEGVHFDSEAGRQLYIELASRRSEILAELQDVFPPKKIEEQFIPKVNNKTRGYVKGVPFTKTRYEEFNPSSRDQIAERLKEKYGWMPSEFTDTGKPKVDEEVLSSLTFPEARLLCQYLEIIKIIGMVGEGRNGWLKLVDSGGRIHGRVVTNGAVTGRCTHNTPNLAQIPARGEYGKRCRALFTAPEGFVQVGTDASGLELRMLGSYLYRYDHGDYIKVILEGDVHTANQKAAGLPTRDMAKTFI